MAHPQDITGAAIKAENRRALSSFLAIAVLAGLVDWATKAMAVGFLTDNTKILGEHFALMLVFNKGAAGGVSWGPYTWLINVCVTTLSVLMISMVVAPLARVDRRAPFALGMVAGGATGNLVSMIAGAEGVADFLAVRFTDSAVVANVADLSLWTGAVLLIPVVRTLVAAIRVEREQKAARGIRFIVEA